MKFLDLKVDANYFFPHSWIETGLIFNNDSTLVVYRAIFRIIDYVDRGEKLTHFWTFAYFCCFYEICEKIYNDFFFIFYVVCIKIDLGAILNLIEGVETHSILYKVEKWWFLQNFWFNLKTYGQYLIIMTF